MKLWAVGSIGAVGAAWLLFWYSARSPSSTHGKGGAEAPLASADDAEALEEDGVPAAAGPSENRGDPDLVDIDQRIDELAKQGSHEAWLKLATLYQKSDAERKKAILTHASEIEDTRRMINTFLGMVGDDPVALEQDPMIAEAAALMKQHWYKPDALPTGRDAMMIEENDKRRFVVAKALMIFAEDAPKDDPDIAKEIGALGADLIGLHAKTSNEFVKKAIADGMRHVGGNDVALVLAEGPNVDLNQLEMVQRDRQAREEALKSIEAAQQPSADSAE